MFVALPLLLVPSGVVASELVAGGGDGAAGLRETVEQVQWAAGVSDLGGRSELLLRLFEPGLKYVPP
ncbi:hypothetical protein AX769_22415 (plasmid) [Frondihabitans sp. PAMC 28766]|nr:hypothetical protein AX769_22415 [Frondihabitans sp. PAMC 28766]